MLDSYMGHAGAIQGVYVICIWGVQRMGGGLEPNVICVVGTKSSNLH